MAASSGAITSTIASGGAIAPPLPTATTEDPLKAIWESLEAFKFEEAIKGITLISDKDSIKKISQIFTDKFNEQLSKTNQLELNSRFVIILKLPESLYPIKDKLVSIWINRAIEFESWEWAFRGMTLYVDRENRKADLRRMLERYEVIRDTISTLVREKHLQLAFNLAEAYIACFTENRIRKGRMKPMPKWVQDYYIKLFQGYCKFECLERTICRTGSPKGPQFKVKCYRLVVNK